MKADSRGMPIPPGSAIFLGEIDKALDDFLLSGMAYHERLLVQEEVVLVDPVT